MTDAQARNERIASWFEPKPTQSMMSPQTGALSPKGAWSYSYIPIDGEGFQWRARDFDTDESANAMLLEAMPSPMLALETLHEKRWGCWPHGLYLSATSYANDPNRKIAIRLAFERWAGLEEK